MRRVSKYVLAWSAINIPLCILWGYLLVPPELAVLLGLIAGSVSTTALMVIFCMRDTDW